MICGKVFQIYQHYPCSIIFISSQVLSSYSFLYYRSSFIDPFTLKIVTCFARNKQSNTVFSVFTGAFQISEHNRKRLTISVKGRILLNRVFLSFSGSYIYIIHMYFDLTEVHRNSWVTIQGY